MISSYPLSSALLSVRGKLREAAALSKSTWFRVGGPAQYLFRPADAGDLAQFLAAKPEGMPVTVLGVGSNLLVRDGGIDGVVIRLGVGFNEVKAESCIIETGAGCLDAQVAQFAQAQGLAGLEFLSGIPGTIGGAVAMNAGAYGSDIASVLAEVEIVDSAGVIWRLSNAELSFRYRGSALPEGAIVTRAWLRAAPGDADEIAARMADIAGAREATQPVRARTGGSTFKNPPGHKAWQLIDAAGCRGLTMGNAQVSELHCNFFINTGDATASEIEALGEEVRTRVLAHSGVALEWEIKRIGKFVDCHSRESGNPV